MIEITERDKKFLLALNETGACNAKFPLKFYAKRYKRDRLEKMERDKIINRKFNLIMLSTEGKKYLESIGEVPRVIDTMPVTSQRRLARALELKYLIPKMEIVPSNDYKKEENLNRGMHFVAVAKTKDKVNYLLYDIPKTLKYEAKSQMLRELRNKKGIIDNAIVFTDNQSFVQELSKKNVYIGELLILTTDNFFIGLLNEMGNGDFDKKIIGAAFPELLESNIFDKKQVQYMEGNNCYYNMVLNNISVFSRLQTMDDLAIKTDISSAQIYNIVCLNFEENYMLKHIEELDLKKINVKIKSLAKGECSVY